MAFPFGSRAIAALIRAIEAGYSHADIGTLLLEANADAWAPIEWPNKQQRLQDLFASLRRDGEHDASSAALDLARRVLEDGSSGWNSQPTWYAPLVAALAADGWEYDAKNARLTSAIPGVSVIEETTILEQELRLQGWSVAAGHYRQALDAFAAGRWASANGQLRSMLEELLQAAAELVSSRRPRDAQACLDALRKHDVLLGGEYGFAKGLWQLCQSSGSHPGLSSEDEARFRLMTVTSYARFLNERLTATT